MLYVKPVSQPYNQEHLYAEHQKHRHHRTR